MSSEFDQALWFSRASFDFDNLDNLNPKDLYTNLTHVLPKANMGQEQALKSWTSTDYIDVPGLISAPKPPDPTSTTPPQFYENIESGFKAHVYIPNGNNPERTIWIAFTGTDAAPDDVNGLAKDIIAGKEIGRPDYLLDANPLLSSPFDNNPGIDTKAQQLIDAEHLFQAVWATVQQAYPGYRIKVTGESLGGGIAEYIGAKYGATAYAFNSVGARNSIELYSGLTPEQICERANLVHVYNLDGDPISSPIVGNQYGIVHKMPAKYSPNSSHYGLVASVPGLDNHIYPLYDGDKIQPSDYTPIADAEAITKLFLPNTKVIYVLPIAPAESQVLTGSLVYVQIDCRSYLIQTGGQFVLYNPTPPDQPPVPQDPSPSDIPPGAVEAVWNITWNILNNSPSIDMAGQPLVSKTVTGVIVNLEDNLRNAAGGNPGIGATDTPTDAIPDQVGTTTIDTIDIPSGMDNFPPPSNRQEAQIVDFCRFKSGKRIKDISGEKYNFTKSLRNRAIQASSAML